MFKWFLNLRNKPENSRKRAALLIASSITFVILLVWFGALISGFNDKSDEPISVDEAQSPVESLGSTISSGLDSVKDLFRAL